MKGKMSAQLVTDALLMAIWRRGHLDALLHHSTGAPGVPAVVGPLWRQLFNDAS
jgi:transposase InsO family protein